MYAAFDDYRVVVVIDRRHEARIEGGGRVESAPALEPEADVRVAIADILPESAATHKIETHSPEPRERLLLGAFDMEHFLRAGEGPEMHAVDGDHLLPEPVRQNWAVDEGPRISGKAVHKNVLGSCDLNRCKHEKYWEDIPK